MPVRPLKSLYSLLGLVVALQLAACSGPEMDSSPLGATLASGVETRASAQNIGAKKLDLVPTPSSFAGAVIADEPHAALIARDVLEKGGNAADAATALYFALSVSYPAAAGLGGGGVCLARDGATGDVTSVSFPVGKAAAGGLVGVPGNVRGIAYIQAKFGTAGWATLVSPAERLAATGLRVSRATAGQLADSAAVIDNASDLARIFENPQGDVYGEADLLMQRELATTLARIRSHGVGGFYEGATGRLLVSESAEKGGRLTQADLSNYRPLVAPATAVSAGELNVMFPVTKTGADSFAIALWPHIQGVSGASALEQAAAKTAGGASDADYGSTAFVTVDDKGGAVACGVSMNGAFGTHREARGSGVIFASASDASGGTFLTPIIVARAKSVEGLYGVIAGAGAPKGGAAAESVVVAALTGVGGAVEKALAASPADARSPVNAIICLEGLPRGSCSLYANPKGAGVGFSAAAAGSF